MRFFHWSFSALLAMLLTHCGDAGNPAATPAENEKPSAAAEVKVSRDNPCSVLLPTEVGDILSVESSLREIMDEMTCRYHFKPAEPDAAKSTDDETFVEVKIHWTGGRLAVATARTAGQLLGSDSNAFEKLEGVGDEAWIAPLASYLAFSKGDIGVEMDMRMIPNEKEKAIRLAQLIASRL